MSYDLPMDENLRGLLVELAEQPERVILSTRVRQFSDLTRPDVEVLKPTTGMGAVEAKLIEAYRDELAHVLLLASRYRHDQVQPHHLRHLAPRDSNGRAQRLDPRILRARTDSLLFSRLANTQPESSLSSLKEAMHTGAANPPSPSALALASLRLVPRTETRIWLGVYVGKDGGTLRAIDLQHRAANEATSGFLAAYAWSNISACFSDLRRFHDAADAARTAAQADPSSSRSAIAWMLGALQAGTRSEVVYASSLVSQLTRGDSDQVEEHVRFLRDSREAGDWAPTKTASHLATSITGLEPAAEKIIETFL